MVELFFDLVFVFANTQLSHALLADVSVANGLRIGLLLLAVWWAWIYTSWATNWLDPDQTAVRHMLFVLILSGLVISAAIPRAFTDRGLAFALAFVVIQVGRTAFACWALRRHSDSHYRNFARITCWLALSGVFWIAGGLLEVPCGCRAGRLRSPSSTRRQPSASGPRISAARRPRTGTSIRRIWRSGARCSSSSRLANRFS